jgi:hypothetical protein
MPSGAGQQSRRPQEPRFEDLPSEAQDFSDSFTQTAGFVDEEEPLEDDVDVDDEDLGSLTLLKRLGYGYHCFIV